MIQHEDRIQLSPLASAKNHLQRIILAVLRQTQSVAERVVPGSNAKIRQVLGYYQRQWQRADEASSEIAAQIEVRVGRIKVRLNNEREKISERLEVARQSVTRLRKVPVFSLDSLQILLDLAVLAPFLGKKINKNLILRTFDESTVSLRVLKDMAQDLYLAGFSQAKSLGLSVINYGSQVQLKLNGLKNLSKAEVFQIVNYAKTKVTTTVSLSKDKITKLVFDRKQLQQNKEAFQQMLAQLVRRVREAEPRKLLRQKTLGLAEWARQEYSRRRSLTALEAGQSKM